MSDRHQVLEPVYVLAREDLDRVSTTFGAGDLGV
jgi:hypothetical protein